MLQLAIICFLLSAVFFVFDGITTTKFNLIITKCQKEIERKSEKAGLLLPICQRWANFNTFCYFCALSFLLLGFLFSVMR